MGGYGIVGGNLPIAAGLALSSEYKGEDAVTVCMFGDGASNAGNFGETMNLAALWKLPVLFLVENNLYGMGTSVERHSAQTDLSKKAEGYGIPGKRIDGMDVIAVREGGRRGDPARPRGAPPDDPRGLHLPLSRPLRRRPRGLPRARGGRGVARERPDRDLRAALRRGRGARRARGAGRRATTAEREVLAAVEFADASPEPPLDTLYENLYVLDGDRRLVRGRRAQPAAAPRRARGPDARRGARAGRGGRRLRRAARDGAARPTRPSDGDAQEGVEPEVAGGGRGLMATIRDAGGPARRDGRGDAPRRGGLRDGRGRRRLPGAPSR